MFSYVHVLSHLGHKVNQDYLNKITALCPCERLYSTLDKLTFIQLAQTDGFQHIHLAAFLFAVKRHLGDFAEPFSIRCAWRPQQLVLYELLYDPTQHQSCHIALLQFSMSTQKHFRSAFTVFWIDLKVVFWICAKTRLKKHCVPTAWLMKRNDAKYAFLSSYPEDLLWLFIHSVLSGKSSG